MGSGSGASSLIGRFLLMVINIVFFLCGGVVLSFGIIALANPMLIVNLFNMIPNISYIQYYINLTQALLNNGILLIVVGGVIVLVTIIGLVGVITRMKVFLAFFSLLTLLLVLGELAFALYVSIAKEQIYSQVADLMFASLSQNFQPIQTINSSNVYYSNVTAAFAWESLQFRYSCCGARNYTDYQHFSWNQQVSVDGILLTGIVVPPSCCLMHQLYYLPQPTANFVNLYGCLRGSPTSTSDRVTVGCYIPVLDILSQYAYGMTIVLASLITIEVISIMLSISVTKKSTKER